ncbi:MAG: site-specific DNA-methyltransferase [Planctomycetes bacterium]|nr:site-specific DNA-methyltransferase [Planctomycetota bacterium]
MAKKKVKSVEPASKDIKLDSIARLKEIFPQIVKDGRIDFETLKKLLGDEFDVDNERYGLNWAGKTDCFRHIKETTTATLKPCRKESIDFDNTENIFIEGDNLEVLKVLQKNYYGKIKMIYIDPPYNTGNDSFIYPDRFKEEKEDYQQRAGIKDYEGFLIKDGFWRKNSKDSGHFHSNWLSMMYTRLFIAKNLLSPDGIMLASIDENEAFHLRLLLDDIFGPKSYAGEFVWNTRHSQQQGLIASYHEYVLVYTKMEKNLYPNFSNPDGGIIIAGALKRISKGNPSSDFDFPNGIRCEAKDGTRFSGKWGEIETVELINGKFIVEDGKTKYPITLRSGWTQRDQMEAYFSNSGPVYDTKGQLVEEFFFTSTGKLKCIKNKSKITPSSILDGFGTVSKSTKELTKLMGGEFFERPKPVNLLAYLIGLCTDPNDTVFDFFAGSCTTAHAVYVINNETKSNRRFICVQLPEPCDRENQTGKNAIKAGFKTISDIGKERIRRSAKKIKKEYEGKLDFDKNKLDLGFKVFKLDHSNFKQWRENIKTAGELKEQIKMFVDNTKKGSASEDMLYETVLKNSRFDLNVKADKKTFESIDYYSLADGDEIVCLADKITKKLVDRILKEKPEKFTCLDIAFKGNDQLKTNTALQMEAEKIEFKII